jgi:hypothetical protein
MEPPKTYGEAVHFLREALEHSHTNAGMLRDYAIDGEKEYFNKVRGLLLNAVVELERLEDTIGNRADMKL